MRLSRVLIIVLLAVFIAGTGHAFDGTRKGFVLGGSVGFSPYITRSTDDDGLFSFTEDDAEMGGAVHLMFGGAWDDRNMLVFHRDVSIYSANNQLRWQGFTGAAWYHYYGDTGKSVFTVVGLGMYTYDTDDGIVYDPGFGFLIGAGREITPHLQFSALFSGGRGQRSGIDYFYNHVSVVLTAVAF